jgi:hypothetical protein
MPTEVIEGGRWYYRTAHRNSEANALVTSQSTVRENPILHTRIRCSRRDALVPKGTFLARARGVTCVF